LWPYIGAVNFEKGFSAANTPWRLRSRWPDDLGPIGDGFQISKNKKSEEYVMPHLLALNASDHSPTAAKRAVTARVLQSLFFIVVVAVMASTTALAQQNGHYLQGVTGLENSSAPPPGFYVTYAPYLDLVDSLKGPDGHTLANVNVNSVVHNMIFEMTTPKKVLGAWYGFDVIVPVVNTRLQGNDVSPSAQSAGLSDIYVAPLVLGWDKSQSTYLVEYGFYAPTGSFNPSNPFNPGLGFWEQQVQAGTTRYFDKRKLWNGSVLSTWEFNQTKSSEDLKPGPMATFEYSFGRRLFHYSVNVGVAGYAYQKLSADSGSAVPATVRGDLDRSFGLGPEFKYTNLKHHVSFDARYEPEFGVQSRPSGNTVVFTLTYLNIFHPK
jgi:hypothetical protein